MDAHSVSYTIPSSRAFSRIYQDLASCRQLIVKHADATITELTMNSTSKIRKFCLSKPPKILVIGAGLAGLRCADILLQTGFDVTIWEARDRVGGRMHQTKLSSGHTVDLGPNWIHGTDQNPMVDLAKQTRTATHTWDDNVNVFDENGDFLPDGRQLGSEMWDIVVQAFKHSSANTLEIDADVSLYDFFQEKVLELVPTDKDSERRRKIILQLAEFWGAFVGSPVTQQSLKYFWLEECINGENLFCAGTYEKILAAIAEPALSGATVRFLTKAIHIENAGEKIRVQSECQSEGEFDEVIVTTPLGWLKRNKAAFLPPLPDRFSNAIDNIGYGSLEKVYISFPRSFWIDKEAKAAERFTGFTQFLSPSYSPDVNPNRWNQESVDLSTLPGDCAHPTLLYYLYGEQSIKLAADLESLPSMEAQQEHLVKFFEPYFSRMPNYQRGIPDCTPVSCLATTWVLDELAGHGSYTTLRTGLQEGDKDIEIMRAGLPERSLWFAGEHTAPFVAVGTVTGAYWSGEAVGRRIALAYEISEARGVQHEKRGCCES